MKLLYYTKYSRLGASSRLRSFQYFPTLEAAGFNVTVLPLFNDQYLNQLYTKSKIGKGNVLKQYLKRVASLFKIYKYDLVIIEKELFPYIPAFFEWVLNLLGVKYVVDYDDAIFHNYDKSLNKLISTLLKNKLKYVMRYSKLVIAGNDYISDYAKRAKAKNIVIIPTVINTDNYGFKLDQNSDEIIICWIGSPSTLKYLKNIKPALENLCQKYPIKVHIIGGKFTIGLPGYEEIIEWTEHDEVDLIRKCDIGIMPLEDSDWERGKCGYKLIQYMGCGLPVVGSPVGVNCKIIENGVNGYQASTLSEWEDYIGILTNDKKLRTTMGLAGKNMVDEKYSLKLTQVEIISLFRSIISN
jgi:glycosyltransferase involved in cell wall biosynthesis